MFLWQWSENTQEICDKEKFIASEKIITRKVLHNKLFESWNKNANSCRLIITFLNSKKKIQKLYLFN
jgi:hypothetical protein